MQYLRNVGKFCTLRRKIEYINLLKNSLYITFFIT